MRISPLVLGIALACLSAPAMALDVEAFADRIEALLKYSGYPVDLGPGSQNGGDVVFDGFSVRLDGISADRLDVDLTFAGVQEFESGYSADRVSVPDIDIVLDAQTRMTWAGISAGGVRIPKSAPNPIDVMTMVETFSAGPMAFSIGGSDIIRIAGIKASSGFDHSLEPIPEVQTIFALKGLDVDLTPIKEADPKSYADVEAMGLSKFSISMEQAIRWIAKEGRIVVDRGFVDMSGMGSFDLQLDVAGFSVDVLDDLYAAQAGMLTAAGDEAAVQRIEMDMVTRLLGAVTIKRVSLDLEDHGLTNRLLDAAAAENGGTRDGFVAMLGVMLRAGVAKDAPGLVDVLVLPAMAFLEDPTRLDIELAADRHLGLDQFMAAASSLLQTGKGEGLHLDVVKR